MKLGTKDGEDKVFLIDLRCQNLMKGMSEAPWWRILNFDWLKRRSIEEESIDHIPQCDKTMILWE